MSATHLQPSRTAAALRELVRTFGLLERVMAPHFARFGISAAQWGVLRTLYRAEQEGLPGLRLTDLGERLLIRPPSVTGAIDRMEKAGLVRRENSPEDLRAKQVVLTRKGRQLLERMLQVHDEQTAEVLSGLAAEEVETLRQLLERLGRHLQGLLEVGPAEAE